MNGTGTLALNGNNVAVGSITGASGSTLSLGTGTLTNGGASGSTTFAGTISGVAKWGIYVEEKESKSEGMIGMRNLGNDYYNFDEKTYSIVGEKTKQKFTLGDPITFKVLAADPEKRTLDYGLVK